MHQKRRHKFQSTSSRYRTATKARRAVLNIQNLLRIVFRIDFGRAVFSAGCAQTGGEDVEMKNANLSAKGTSNSCGCGVTLGKSLIIYLV